MSGQWSRMDGWNGVEFINGIWILWIDILETIWDRWFIITAIISFFLSCVSSVGDFHRSIHGCFITSWFPSLLQDLWVYHQWSLRLMHRSVSLHVYHGNFILIYLSIYMYIDLSIYVSIYLSIDLVSVSLNWYGFSFVWKGDVGSYYYGPGHPTKPHRSCMTHSICLAYGSWCKTRTTNTKQGEEEIE